MLSEPWSLSTSQIPQYQIRMFDPNQYPNHLGAGGGFGPVSTPEGEWLAAPGPWSFSLRGADMGTSTLLREDPCECKVIAADLGRQVPAPTHSSCLPSAASPRPSVVFRGHGNTRGPSELYSSEENMSYSGRRVVIVTKRRVIYSVSPRGSPQTQGQHPLEETEVPVLEPEAESLGLRTISWIRRVGADLKNAESNMGLPPVNLAGRGKYIDLTFGSCLLLVPRWQMMVMGFLT